MDYLVGRMSYIFFCVTNFKFNEEVLYMKKKYIKEFECGAGLLKYPRSYLIRSQIILESSW